MNKYLLLVSLFLWIAYAGFAQNFKGQWKGTFLDKSTSFVGWGGDRCDYVLELEVSGKDVKGYSYTYFTDGGKKYYTICSLKGFINKPGKYIEIRETVRTKTNVPNTIRNCFQVHKLTYNKQDDTEILEGSWVPAPGQVGDCGYGNTTLQRRILKKNYSLYNPAAKKINSSPINKKRPVPAEKNKKNTTVAKPTPKKKDSILKPKNEVIEEPVEMPLSKAPIQDKIVAPIPSFEKRNNNVIKTIEVENATVRVDLYDNGEIDGDSVSLFYNGKLLLSNKKLSDKPISVNVTVDTDASMNELVMYAENLGAIPPNTALMVVYDGPNSRYEARITSDLQKSGTIRFLRKIAKATPTIPGN